MPEAPEVGFLRDYIHGQYTGMRLKSVAILKGRYVKHGPPMGFAEFAHALPIRLLGVERKGKALFFRFEKDWCMVSRLGLMGWWYSSGDAPQWMTKPEPNLVFEFASGRKLLFTDTLSYGTLKFTRDPQRDWDGLAPDVERVSLAALMKRINAREKYLASKTLEDIVTDQHLLFSGIGNYLKAEVLYDARLSPFRTIASLTPEDWKRILQSARKVISKMRKSMSNPDISVYEKTMKVYMKKLDPLGNVIQKHRTKRAGRITYWVPVVQK